MAVSFRGRPLEQVTAADLAGLVEGRTPESRTLEYKRDLPGPTDADKREFLADVSALANTAGGVVLYGVETDPADKGVPRAVVGVDAPDLDAVLLRLGGLLHDGVSPSLAAQVRLVPVSRASPEGRPVLAVGVPRSLAAPHRVVAGRANRFYRRTDAGKYEPDVPELRRMFVDAQSLVAEADAFRRDRVRRIAAGAVRPDARAAHPLFVHVLPVGRLDQLLDLRSREGALRVVPPLGTSGWDRGFNADGFWTFVRGPDAPARLRAYTQWFRFGGVELFAADYTGPGSPTARAERGAADGPASGQPAQDGPIFHGRSLVRDLCGQLPEVLALLTRTLNVDPPFAVLLTLGGMTGARMVEDPTAWRFGVGEVPDRAELALPPVLLEGAEGDVGAALRPGLDALWQAFGYPGVPEAYLTTPPGAR